MGIDEDIVLAARIITIALIAVASAAFSVVFCSIAVGWCNRRRTNRTPSSIENSSMVECMPPAHKYRKGEGLVGEDGTTCAVCLSEFEEGEELRTLSQCMHSFHVPCIDMWFYSHSNCPICRTPQIFRQSPDFSSGGPETARVHDVTVVQSQTV